MKPHVRLLIIPAVLQALLCLPAAADKNDDSNAQGKNQRREQPSRQNQPKPAPARPEQAPQQKIERPAAPKVERQPEKRVERPAAPKVERQPEKKVERPAAPKVERQPEKKVERPAAPKVERQPEKRTERPAPPKIERQPETKVERPSGPKNDEPAVKKEPQTRGNRERPPVPDAPKRDRTERVPQVPTNPKVPTLPERTPQPADKGSIPTPPPIPGAPDPATTGRGTRNPRDRADAKDKPRDNQPQPMPLPGRLPGKDSAGRDRVDPTVPGNDRPVPDRRDPKRPDRDVSDRRDSPRPGKLDLPGKRPVVPVTGRDDGFERREQANRDRKARERELAGNRLDVPRGKPVVRPGQNTRPIRQPEFVKNDRPGRETSWWNNDHRDAPRGGRDVQVSRIAINNNFTRNVNWSTRRGNWGYNPWWNRPQVRPWYGSSWNWGWNRNYYHDHYYYDHGYRPPGYNSTRAAIGWGLVGWSLGSLVYDTGYRSYYNPYPVSTVVVGGGYDIDYSQPITRIAVSTAPADDAAIAENTRKSESIIVESQAAFKQRNYLAALELANKAIAESPGDGALHEYRALVLFALGKYGEAAGVLNPVLASGPGWDWSTMIALYDAQETYTDQLQKLEAYSEQKPDAADLHFLLGYHYMVCGYLDLATPQFEQANKLMPKDNVSRELADLTRASADPADEKALPEKEEPGAENPAPVPVPLEKLTGVWTSSRASDGSVTLTFRPEGKFTWSYLKEGKTTEFSGDYSINDNGLLVLDSDETQMVASVDLPKDSEMKFVLAGGPPDDPGLDFTKD